MQRSWIIALGAMAMMSAAESSRAGSGPGGQDAAEDSRMQWSGTYWGGGVGASGTTLDIKGTGSSDNRDVEGKSASIFAVLGYNMLVDGWLLGLEADLGGAAIDAKSSVTGLGSVSFEAGTGGSVRARFGYAWDRFMIYGTAGVAAASMDISSSLGGSEKGLAIGGVVGFGTEVAIDADWRIRAEALAYGFTADDVELAGSKRDLDVGMATVRMGFTRRF